MSFRVGDFRVVAALVNSADPTARVRDHAGRDSSFQDLTPGRLRTLGHFGFQVDLELEVVTAEEWVWDKYLEVDVVTQRNPKSYS